MISNKQSFKNEVNLLKIKIMEKFKLKIKLMWKKLKTNSIKVVQIFFGFQKYFSFENPFTRCGEISIGAGYLFHFAFKEKHENNGGSIAL